MLFGRCPTYLGIGPRAKTTSHVASYVQFHIRITHQQSLRIGIQCDELDAADTGLDHSVDGVDSTATNPNDFDHGQIGATCIAQGGITSIQLKSES